MKTFQNIIMAMPPFLLCLLIPVVALSESGEDVYYYVIHVRGEVRVGDSENPLKLKDKITLAPDNRVSFSYPKAAAVLMGRKGRHVLIPDDLMEKEQSELVGFFKTCFLPARKLISTRGLGRKRLKEELDFLISTLRKFGKNNTDIARESFGFIMDTYFDKNDENKARNILKDDFGVDCRAIPALE